MVGWVLVVDTRTTPHPCGLPGKAQLDNVPPGTYTLPGTWHARLPVGALALERALTVPATEWPMAAVRMTGLQP